MITFYRCDNEGKQQTKFSGMTLFSFIIISAKFQLKLMSAKYLLPMIFINKLFITLSTPWFHQLFEQHQVTMSYSKQACVHMQCDVTPSVDSLCWRSNKLLVFYLLSPKYFFRIKQISGENIFAIGINE